MSPSVRVLPVRVLPVRGHHRPDGHLLDTVVRYHCAGSGRMQGPDPDHLGAHLDRYGERPQVRGEAGERLVATLETAGLTGRGGAHFPVAAKWRAALDAGGGGVVIVNGAESEPLSAKDAALLQHRPHLVLDGLACAAEAVGAIGAAVWLHEGAGESHRAVAGALRQRRAHGGDPLAVRLAVGPGRYVSGESSAVVQALEGGPALPAFTRAPAAVHGVHGLPTLVHNVETMALIGLLARTGGAGPRPGPLVTILGGDVLTVSEFPADTTVSQAYWFAQPAILAPVEPQAVLLGGYGGRWCDWAQVADLPLGRLDGGRPVVRPSGSNRRRLHAVTAPMPSLGAGILAPLPHDACGLAETAAVLRYLADSSARQCGPCLFGTRELADGMARIAQGTARRKEVEKLQRLTGQVERRGACGLPDGAVQLTRSALSVFEADLGCHLRTGECRHPGGRAILPIPVGGAW
jgi:NADH:ubiquinone oxidoreductase subunit F (NADH-binding)